MKCPDCNRPMMLVQENRPSWWCEHCRAQWKQVDQNLAKEILKS